MVTEINGGSFTLAGDFVVKYFVACSSARSDLTDHFPLYEVDRMHYKGKGIHKSIEHAFLAAGYVKKSRCFYGIVEQG